MSARSVDVCVVGAGPAGIAAACLAAETGKSVVLLDEGLAPGGQIWRRAPDAAPGGPAAPWLDRLRRAGAEVLARASLAEIRGEDGGFALVAEHEGARLEVRAGAVVLATGAREVVLPFPGWTLPEVMAAGGLQALAKSGLDLGGRRVVLAGSGPLLLAAAEALAAAGAEVAAVAEQAPESALAGLGLRLLGSPGKLLEGARHRRALGRRYRAGRWIARAEGRGRLEAAVITDGRTVETIPCDLLGVSCGLVPASEAALLLGADVRRGAVTVGDRQETSLPGLYAAGEVCGIAGADVALAEGQIAGRCAAGREPAAGLLSERRHGRVLAQALERAFALRPEVLRPPPPGTIVCRCEDVRFGDLDPGWGTRQAKLLSRVGMGACQGRTCGPALARLLGWEADAVRPPLRPVALSTLVSPED